MTHRGSELSLAERLNFAQQSAEALLLLHEGRYDAVIPIYEELNKLIFTPANSRFLARAYVSIGRIAEGIETLAAALEREPDDEAAAELAFFRANAFEWVIRSLMSGLKEGRDEAWCRSMLERNRPLIDTEFFQNTAGNASHCIDRREVRHAPALALITRGVADLIGDPDSQGLATELASQSALIEGDYPKALLYARESARFFDRPETQEELAAALVHVGNVAMNVGGYAEAEDAYTRAIRGFEALGDRENAARTIENLGETCAQQSDYQRGAELALEAERRYRLLNDEMMALNAMCVRAQCLANMGQFAEALPLLRTAIARGRQLWADTPIHLAFALSVHASTLEGVGRLKESAAARKEADEIYRSLDMPVPGRIEDAAVMSQVNDFETAVETMKGSIRELEKSGFVVAAASEKMNLANTYLRQLGILSTPGADVQQEELYQSIKLLLGELKPLLVEAIATFRKHHARGYLLHALSQRVRVTAALDLLRANPAGALEQVDWVLRLAEELNEPAEIATLKQNRAQILLEAGRVDEAMETLRDIDLTRAEAGDEDLLMYIHLTLADALARKRQNADATAMYLRAVELYEVREQLVGDTDWARSWSKSEISRAFDRAIEHMTRTGDVARAFEVVQRAKARTFRQALAERT